MFSGHNAIGVYLSGAAKAGASQKADLSSLGGYRAAERLVCLRWHRYNPITGLRIEYVSGACGPGLARLQVVSADTVRYAAPGDSYGATVRVGVGQAAVLPSYRLGDSTATQRYCIVYRPTIGDLGGSETLQLMDTANNVVGGSNFTEAESAAGAYHYRCVYLRNDSDLAGTPQSVADLRVWLDSATNLAIALQAPTADNVAAVANESTAPTGPTFSSPTSYAAGLAVPTLAAGASHALWIRNAIGASNTTPEPLRDVLVRYANAATAPTVAGALRGVTRVAVGGIAGYRVWAGQDAEPNYDGAADLELPTLPDDIVLTPGHTYYLRAKRRNQYGLESAPQEIATLRVNALGELDEGPPRGPSAVSVEAGPGGALVIRAQYLPNMETVSRADTWRIYVQEDGTAPNPPTATPVDVAMAVTVGTTAVSLTHTTTATYQDGQTLAVLVRTVRSSDGAESTNAGYQTVTVNGLAPGRPQGTASIGTNLAVTPTVVSPTTSTQYFDQPKNIRLVANADGSVSFYVDTVLVWRVVSTSPIAAGVGPGGTGAIPQRFYIPSDWALTDRNTISGSDADPVFEVVSWDPSDRVVALTAQGVYRVLIDATNKTISVSAISDRLATATFTPPGLAYGRADGAYLGAWDAVAEELRIVAHTSAADTTWRVAVGLDLRYSQAQIEAM